MNIIFSLLCNNDFPTLAQNVGMAALTILIPVAIVIFSSDKDFRELDNHLRRCVAGPRKYVLNQRSWKCLLLRIFKSSSSLQLFHFLVDSNDVSCLVWSKPLGDSFADYATTTTASKEIQNYMNLPENKPYFGGLVDVSNIAKKECE